MMPSVFRLIACLSTLALSDDYALSGKVTGPSGNGLAGIWVGLTQAKLATLTASDGSWSIGAAVGIAPRAAKPIAEARHLVLDGARLRVAFDGKDLAGRNLPGLAGSAPTIGLPRNGARTAGVIADTLLYVHGGNLLATTAVNSASFQAGTIVLDTGSRGFTYTVSAQLDTLRIISNSKGRVEIECSNSVLNAWIIDIGWENHLLRMTWDGFELSELGSTGPDTMYRRVTKFHRLSGESGSMIGRFYHAGEVYRPTIATVPDSVVRIIAEDSVASAAIAAREGLVYEFTDATISLVGANAFSFVRQFHDYWTKAYGQRYYFISYDSSWSDGRSTSDSAMYDVGIRAVDSSTVRLTGGRTQEVVTLTVPAPGMVSASGSGPDVTCSSSNSAHPKGVQQAVPTSCPEAAGWYWDFLRDNVRVLAAGRGARLEGATAPRTRMHHLF